MDWSRKVVSQIYFYISTADQVKCKLHLFSYCIARVEVQTTINQFQKTLVWSYYWRSYGKHKESIIPYVVYPWSLLFWFLLILGRND